MLFLKPAWSLPAPPQFHAALAAALRMCRMCAQCLQAGLPLNSRSLVLLGEPVLFLFSLLCLQPGTPRPLPAPTPGVSAFREGGDRTNQAMGLAAASLLRAALSWRRAGWSPHVSSPVPRPSGSKASPGLSSSMRGSPCSLRMTLQERRTAVQG